ncbi:hypothetical protein ACWECC_24985 [Streptomyces microflavus]|uniref:hypothetical protein n=1 Tax=Streptomyces microflavus TaxID=1919 RepID=UPI0034353F23
MSADAMAGVTFVLVILVVLGACHLHDKADERKEAQRRWQRLQDALKEQEIAARTRKYNTMHAMRRTARNHQEGR